MFNLVKKTVLGSALAATAMLSATPAMADSYRGGRHDDGAGTAIAIGAGILGIAAIAAIASSHNKDRDYDGYNRGYNGGYNGGGTYYRGYVGNGYYENQRRWHRHEDHDGYRGYDQRGYDDRGYDRRGYDQRGDGYRGY